VDGDPLAAAAEVERALYEAFLPEGRERGEYEASGGASSKDYKAKFRTLSFNLKDSKNPDLRRAVLNGQVAAADLLTLSPEELVRRPSCVSHRARAHAAQGSEERRLGNQRIREHAMWECERGQKSQARIACALLRASPDRRPPERRTSARSLPRRRPQTSSSAASASSASVPTSSSRRGRRTSR